MSTISQAIGWVIVIAFAITFAVTIGALIKKIKIDRRYLTPLFVKLILEVIAAGLFLFYNGFNACEQPPYAGKWKASIYWKESYAQTLFNFDKVNINFQPINPRSEGDIYIYVESGVYRGFSIWETKNGTETYSRLAVIPSHFEFTPSDTLKSFWLKTAIREKTRDFNYAPFASYRMEFTYVSESKMIGKMILYKDGQEMEVGDVILERE
jgi:hypothetical protein